jgi:hypothetical protein
VPLHFGQMAKMSEEPIGYRNPPKSGRWQRGRSGNPRGRPKRKPISLIDIIIGFLNTPIPYREKGKVKTAPPEELLFRRLIEDAMKGSIAAADFILELRKNARKFSNVGREEIEISDWLPDYPGQTGEQKTEDASVREDINPLKWWESPGERGPAPQEDPQV